MNFLKLLLPVIFACLFNTAANALWKAEFMKRPFQFTDFSKLIAVFFSPKISIGILFYMGSMLLFFYMLSNFKLSLIIPLTSLTYVFNMVSAYFVFNEKISVYSLIGTLIIIIGIVILSQAPIIEKV